MTRLNRRRNVVYIPGVAHAYTMIDIAENKLEQLVCQDTGSIREPKERMIGKHSPQTHGSCMQDAFVAERTQTAVAVDNFNLFTDTDVS